MSRTALWLSWLVLSLACGPAMPEPDRDAPGSDAGMTDSGADAPGLDAPGLDAGPPGIAVSHARELRAVWVSSVFRLDFPSAAGLSESAIAAELRAIVDLCEETGLNAIYFQVRPESDALYESELEPWSRFLSGTQGTDPGYDPLAMLLSEAHPRGIEVHAWINPYRAETAPAMSTTPLHVTQRFPDAAILYDGVTVMDPSDTDVRAHVVSVVRDIVTRYDVDGVVFDDYFYPYPEPGMAFPDADRFDAYQDGGGALSLGDWRRDNVNRLIEDTAAAIEDAEPWVRFGVAPFGIYRPGMPAGVVGLDAYEAISCDPLAWLEGGWVDYVAPQLYWPSTSTGQPFGDLVAWWAEQGGEERPIIPALAPYRLGTSADWTIDELATQIELTRAEAPTSAGASWFRLGFMDGSDGDEATATALRARMATLHATPARPPRVPDWAPEVAMPSVTLAGSTASLAHSGDIAGYAVYREGGASYALEAWVPASDDANVTLTTGQYAISAIDRGGAESLGAPVTVP